MSDEIKIPRKLAEEICAAQAACEARALKLPPELMSWISQNYPDLKKEYSHLSWPKIVAVKLITQNQKNIIIQPAGILLANRRYLTIGIKTLYESEINIHAVTLNVKWLLGVRLKNMQIVALYTIGPNQPLMISIDGTCIVSANCEFPALKIAELLKEWCSETDLPGGIALIQLGLKCLEHGMHKRSKTTTH